VNLGVLMVNGGIVWTYGTWLTAGVLLCCCALVILERCSSPCGWAQLGGGLIPYQIFSLCFQVYLYIGYDLKYCCLLAVDESHSLVSFNLCGFKK